MEILVMGLISPILVDLDFDYSGGTEKLLALCNPRMRVAEFVAVKV